MTQEMFYLHKAGKALADGKVKESLDYYGEDSSGAIELAMFVDGLEKLLNVVTEGCYTVTGVSDRENSDSTKWGRYTMELNALRNQMIDLKERRYYELHRDRGTPLITTVGDRVSRIIDDIIWKAENNLPGDFERIIEYQQKSTNIFPDVPDNY